jgi:hypothetical protein
MTGTLPEPTRLFPTAEKLDVPPVTGNVGDLSRILVYWCETEEERQALKKRLQEERRAKYHPEAQILG